MAASTDQVEYFDKVKSGRVDVWPERQVRFDDSSKIWQYPMGSVDLDGTRYYVSEDIVRALKIGKGQVRNFIGHKMGMLVPEPERRPGAASTTSNQNPQSTGSTSRIPLPGTDQASTKKRVGDFDSTNKSGLRRSARLRNNLGTSYAGVRKPAQRK